MWVRPNLSKFKSGVSNVSSWIMAKRLKMEKGIVNNIDKRDSFTILSTANTVGTNIIEGASNILSEITYLQPPTKSQSDVKEYSVVKLSNGLTALLISDKSQAINPDLVGFNVESETDSEGSSGSESDDSYISGSEIELDGKSRSSEEKLAACALCIGVGSFSDPENIPGLAHFLEHMIFMGSKKYPKENEFDAYIKKKGGSDNASTECEYTTFYFDCHETHLFGAMEIFSQLFVEPLMKKESMTKEREAIESEFQMNLPSDESRRSQLLCSLAVKDNPAHKFMWGNLTTLRDKIKDDDLYEAVHEFRRKHYSANRMTLAVQSRLPLEMLEKWVKECFRNVHNNGSSADKFSVTGPPFKEQEFFKLYIVDPVKNIDHLDLTWVVPPTLKLYRSKPLHYLSWIIGHEGKGSLLSYLRKKLWCIGVSVSGGGDGTEENSIYSLFSISLVLTQEGVQHIQEILDSVFQYIKMFQLEGPQERLFKEIQLIAETSFRFSEEVTSADNVEQLSENMQFYPSTDYISGMELYFEFDPRSIQMFLNKLRADNVNIMLSSKALAASENLDKIEPWFGTKYKCKDIPMDWVTTWLNSDLNHEFHLPGPNPFIPTNFTILPKPKELEEFPKNILQDDSIELWYKQDVTFNLPNAFCCLHLVSPLARKTAHNAAMIDLFISILKQTLNEELYPANAAQLEYGVYFGEKGIVITVNGYNEKIKLLLGSVIDGMVSLQKDIKSEMFLALKDELKRGYANDNLKTGFLAREIRMSILLENYWTGLDKQNALQDISCNTLKTFISNYFDHLYVQGLIQGNVSKEEAIEVVSLVKNKLQYKVLLPDILPEIRVHQLPSGEKYCVVQSFNAEDANSVVTNYYQSGLGTIQESCIIEMLLMLMEEPLFDSLRTKQQLGYDVSCSLRDTFGILGFSVSVHCQSDKNSVESVESKITNFLKEFLDVLRRTTIEEYKEVQESLIKLKNCADVHLKQEVKRNWDEIKNKEYVFDRHLKEKTCIEKLTLQDLIEWFEDTAGLSISKPKLHASPNLKKLSTQVVGKSNCGPGFDDIAVCKEIGISANSLADLKTELNFIKRQETSDTFIFNINDFKKTLPLFPAHKISH